MFMLNVSKLADLSGPREAKRSAAKTQEENVLPRDIYARFKLLSEFFFSDRLPAFLSSVLSHFIYRFRSSMKPKG